MKASNTVIVVKPTSCPIEKSQRAALAPLLTPQRGKFYPQLTNLVRINTPRAVQTESRKAFRKLPNLDAAITTLCGLKGVGCTLASGGEMAGPALGCCMAFLYISMDSLVICMASLYIHPSV